MQMILITDALDAMERNIKVFLDIATKGKAGNVVARIDVHNGTASISHHRNVTSNKIDCEVNFPALPAQHRLSKEEIDRWIGYFIHELCHAVFTDEHAWRTSVIEGLSAIVNGLEDPRIERELIKRLIAANAFELLNSLMSWCVDKLPANYDVNDTSNLPWLFAMAGRVQICGYRLPKAEAHLGNLNPAMRAMLDWVMADLDKAKSTSDVLNIARKLKKAMAAQPKPQGQPKPEGQPGEGQGEGKPEGEPEGKGEGQGQPEDCEGQPEGQPGEGKGEGKPEGQPKPEGQAEGNGEGQPGGAPSGSIEDSSVKPVDLSPLSDATDKASRDLRKRIGDAYGEIAIIDAIRIAQKNAGKPFSKLSGMGEESTMARVITQAQAAGKLRAQVACVLKSEESESWERAKSTGRLDRFALTRVAAGNADVFAKRSIASGYETEIEVLCDGSGSMQGQKAFATGTLAYVIAQAAQQVGVKCGISRFNSSRPQAVKLPSESLSASEVRNRVALLAEHVNGGTDLTGAIVHASAKLADRAPMKRKLLFVVSDGECCNGPSGIRRANAYAARLGVETVVLCIDTPLHPGFGLGVECRSSDVAAAGLGVLVKALSRE